RDSPAPHRPVGCSFFFSSRRRHTRFSRDWSSDVCSSDLIGTVTDGAVFNIEQRTTGVIHAIQQFLRGGVLFRWQGNFLAWRWSQGFQVGRHGIQVFISPVLGTVLDHLSHGTKSSGNIGATSFEEIYQFIYRPDAQAAMLTAQALGTPAINYCTSEEAFRTSVGQANFLETDTTFGMTGTAVPRTLDQILTVV